MAVICEFEFINNNSEVAEFEPLLRADATAPVFYGRVEGTSLHVYQEFRESEDEIPVGVPFYMEVELKEAVGKYKIIRELERETVFKCLSEEEGKFALWDDLLPKEITYYRQT